MFIIVPDEITGLVDLEKNFEKVTVEQLLRGMESTVDVYLPKFRIESEIEFEKPLSKVSNFFISRWLFLSSHSVYENEILEVVYFDTSHQSGRFAHCECERRTNPRISAAFSHELWAKRPCDLMHRTTVFF